MIKRIFATGLLLTLPLFFTLTGCFERTDQSENQEQEILAVGLYQSLQPQIEIAGNWDYYNGTVDTTQQGTMSISNSMITQVDILWGTPPLSALIVEFDNNRRILYGQNTSDHPYGANLFTWYKWTESGGKFYICPDLTGYQITLDEAKAEDTTLSADESNLDTGCSGWFWSRLEVPPS